MYHPSYDHALQHTGLRIARCPSSVLQNSVLFSNQLENWDQVGVEVAEGHQLLGLVSDPTFPRDVQCILLECTGLLDPLVVDYFFLEWLECHDIGSETLTTINQMNGEVLHPRYLASSCKTVVQITKYRLLILLGGI